MELIMNHIFSSFLLAIIATTQLGAGSQEIEYIFGFPRNFEGTTYMRVIITSTSTASEQVTVSSIDKVLFAGHVGADRPVVVDVPKEMEVLSELVMDKAKGIRVTTSSEDLSVVAVNSYNPRPDPVPPMIASTASFKVLPYKKLAAREYNYYAITTNSISDQYSSEILLVAYEDNTKIEIKSPSEDIMLNVPRDMMLANDSSTKATSHFVTLDRMQTLLIKDASHDLTGTLISSNHQLAVITGHECGNVPTTQENCDHLLVQVPPTYSWGKEFLLFPMEYREAGQNFKVIASHHGTSISLTCGKNSKTTITLKRKGNFEEFHTSSDNHCSLVSNKPVLVALLGLGFEADDIGDPSMVLISPISHFKDQTVIFNSLNESDFTQQYVTIVTPSKSSKFTFDGRKIPSYFWTKIPGPDGKVKGYVVSKKLQSSQFNRPITITSPGIGFAAYIYGFDSKSRHSYSFVLSHDQLSPMNVPVLSFHNGGSVYIEKDGVLSIGLGRVDVINNELDVKISISGCSSSTESFIALAAEVPQDFELVGHGESNDLSITKTVTFSSGEADMIIEAIRLVDDEWTEPMKGIQVELHELNGQPFGIMGYDETIISILDNDVLKIDVTVEESRNATESSGNGAGAVEVIIIKVEVSDGKLLPGEEFPILLKGLFPNGSFSSIEEEIYLSNETRHQEWHVIQQCAMGSYLNTLIEVDPDVIESKIPFEMNDYAKKWLFKSCLETSLPLPTKTHTLSSSNTATTINTQLSLNVNSAPSISKTSSLLPQHSSPVFKTTSVSQFPTIVTTSPSFIASQAPSSSVPTQQIVNSVWRSSSHSENPLTQSAYLTLKPSSTSSRNTLTLSHSLSVIHSTVSNSLFSDAAEYTTIFAAETPPTIPPVDENTDESMLVLIVIGVLTAVAVILSILTLIILLIVIMYKKSGQEIRILVTTTHPCSPHKCTAEHGAL